MATMTATITLDDGTVVAAYTSTFLDSNVTKAINSYAAAKNYQVNTYDSDGNLVTNPESAGVFMLRTNREDAAALIQQYLIQQASTAAKAEVLATPVTL